jgi:ElaB/YqjD/DUF883 family membrane-anchored ribosome-binding protein
MANEPANDGEVDVEFKPDPAIADGPVEGAAPDNTADKVRGATQLVKDEASKYTGQAGDKIRAFADDGKARATGMLEELARTIEEAAGTIDEKVGAQFGGYARTASSAVSDFSQKVANKDVDEFVSDAREFVKKSPGVAIGAAAAIGFVLARVLRSGVDANRDA